MKAGNPESREPPRQPPPGGLRQGGRAVRPARHRIHRPRLRPRRPRTRSPANGAARPPPPRHARVFWAWSRPASSRRKRPNTRPRCRRRAPPNRFEELPAASEETASERSSVTTAARAPPVPTSPIRACTVKAAPWFAASTAPRNASHFQLARAAALAGSGRWALTAMTRRLEKRPSFPAAAAEYRQLWPPGAAGGGHGWVLDAVGARTSPVTDPCGMPASRQRVRPQRTAATGIGRMQDGWPGQPARTSEAVLSPNRRRRGRVYT